MLGVTRRFLGDVTWRYASGPHGPLLPSSLDFIRIGFFHHTGLAEPKLIMPVYPLMGCEIAVHFS